MGGVAFLSAHSSWFLLTRVEMRGLLKNKSLSLLVVIPERVCSYNTSLHMQPRSCRRDTEVGHRGRAMNPKRGYSKEAVEELACVWFLLTLFSKQTSGEGGLNGKMIDS